MEANQNRWRLAAQKYKRVNYDLSQYPVWLAKQRLTCRVPLVYTRTGSLMEPKGQNQHRSARMLEAAR